MAAVTSRIREIKQPRGGYLPIKNFTVQKFNDRITLNKKENVSPALVGLAVDYLTRFLLTKDVLKAFDVSYKGAQLWDKVERGAGTEINGTKTAKELMQDITGLDDLSILRACQLAEFDTIYRRGPRAFLFMEMYDSLPDPDQDTIFNIRQMVLRTMQFWDKFGPVTRVGFTMDGAYTKQIHSGDGDYLTESGLWDLKTNKRTPTTKQSLQILIYYLMGRRSIHPYFKDIKTIGLFNARLNYVYTFETSQISQDTIKTVEKDVIGY